MARSYRSESAANGAMADQARRTAQTREDWRAVLAARDSKRAARRARLARQASRPRTSAGFAHIAYMLGIIAFSMLTLAAGFSLAGDALHSLRARPSCDAPIVAAADRAAVLAMVDCE